MKVKVVSDLHLEMCDRGDGVPNLGEGEVLILGGDILCARHLKSDGVLKKVYDDFLNECAQNFNHVLYIAGNHESYGYNYEGSWNVLRENLPKNITLLENQYVKIEDWIFYGCTLWTNFRNENPLEMMNASQCMNDYRAIRITEKYRKLNPNDTLLMHKQSMKIMTDCLTEFQNEKFWILTHHGPSYQSVHQKYKNDCNGAYVTDLDDFILDRSQIKYWSHGHTHESFDYKIGDCRVVCNPRGYYNGYNSSGLNVNFNVNLHIEI